MIAPSHRLRSPYPGGEPVTMYTHHSSEAPEDALSDHETSSNTTLFDRDDELEWSTAPSASLIDESHPLHHTLVSPAVFPIHLISACSAAGRAMCQISGSMTASQEARKVLELRGMSRTTRWVACWMHWWVAPRRRAGPLRFRHRSARQLGLLDIHATMQEQQPRHFLAPG